MKKFQRLGLSTIVRRIDQNQIQLFDGKVFGESLKSKICGIILKF